MPGKYGGYSDDDFAPFVTGAEPPPNFEPLNLHDGIAALVTLLTLRSTMMPAAMLHPSGGVERARYFFRNTLHGDDGSGYVLWHDDGGGHIARFAICNHERILLPGANSLRGHEPAKCRLCEFNMTVDSSG